MITFCITERFDDASKSFSHRLRETLEKKNYHYDDKAPDVIFVIGGDGTFLKAVHDYIDIIDTVKFVGLHTGTLGFFSDYTDEEYDQFIDAFLNKTPQVQEYQLLDIKTDLNDHYYALNEMRIESVLRTLKVDVSVNDVFFERFSGSGLCVCTQLGSTAYNHSLKGAVLSEGLPLIQMSEIAGIHNRIYRSLGSSIVLKEDAQIQFDSDNFIDTKLCIDQYMFSIDECHKLMIALSNKKVKVLRYKNISYFERLKNLF